ncbi:hypothetical protein [Actibacterium sp. XHP0104]|uniref:hypothetical protein n=1 Tax=Actibacterium sp. XHP0104 TaxID=2984335 RepID=UPI0021E84097|nr:hypothetical protein [Actibacterium sp. XHP0104]MCV2881991.1 hypothetical protein [Actibacterium sp. XHP0104]
MKNNLRIVAVAVAFFVSGCASQIMESYVGKDITEVIVKYGPPMNMLEMPDGRKAFQWRVDSNVVLPSTTTYNATTYGNVTTGYATTTGGYVGSSRCVYTLYAKENAQDSFTVIGYEKPTLMCE